jgi:hypothetical protein
MSLEMAHKVIVPPKKNYIPQFLKQRDINSYCFLKSGGGKNRAVRSAMATTETMKGKMTLKVL